MLRIKHCSETPIPEHFVPWMKGEEPIYFNTTEGYELLKEMIDFVNEHKIRFWDSNEIISIPRLIQVIRENYLWQFFEPELKNYRIVKEMKLFSEFGLKMEI